MVLHNISIINSPNNLNSLNNLNNLNNINNLNTVHNLNKLNNLKNRVELYKNAPTLVLSSGKDKKHDQSYFIHLLSEGAL